VVLDVDGGERRGHAWGSRRREGSHDRGSHGSSSRLGVVVHGRGAKVEEGSRRGREAILLYAHHLCTQQERSNNNIVLLV
jgi:hypothetical protein